MTQRRAHRAAIGLLIAITSATTAPALAQVTFAPDTTDQYIRDWQAHYGRQNHGERYVGGTPWVSRNIAWSFVPDSVNIPATPEIPGAGNSNLFTRMDALFNDNNASTNDRNTWQGVIAEAFARWERICGANFAFTRRLTGGVGDDPAVNNWDDGAIWGEPGPLGGDSSVRRGDIRIGMRNIDGAGNAVAAFALGPDGGDIILDSAENWAAGAPNYQFFRSVVARVIGSAIGLEDVCPENNTKLMEPRIPALLTFTRPQFDDIRGANFLYGDPFEPNDQATTNGSVLILGSDTIQGLSLSDGSDQDFFRFVLGAGQNPADITITATPVGATYESGPFVNGVCTSAPINSGATHNLQIQLGTDGNNLPAPTNTAAAGLPEVLSQTLQDAGTYYIRISAAAGGLAGESQMYDLNIVIVDTNSGTGLAFGPIVRRVYRTTDDAWVDPQIFIEPEPGTLSSGLATERGPVGHAAAPVYNDGFTGTRARVGNLESEHVWTDHDAFFGRSVRRLNWTGTSPTVTLVDDHATAAAGAAVGRQLGIGNSFFRGVAPDAQLVSATLASELFDGGFFSVSPPGLYYALFTLASPQFAAAAGLSGPVNVINSSWGGLGDYNGDGFNARAYDATVSMFNTTIVVAAGNNGDIDNAAGCGPGGDIPGGEYKGSRTVGSPASAYNVISVGAVGKSQNPPPTEEEQDDGGGGDDGKGNPGGGGGGPGDPGGGGGGQTIDVPDLPLVAIPAFSSKGPIDTYNFDEFEQELNVRPGVHVVAAGTGEVAFSPNTEQATFPDDPCEFEGNRTISQLSLPTINPANPFDTSALSPIQGTSFSAPTVAGAVALLQDVGLANNYSIDPLVMKAIILNGAVKLPGWSNSDVPAQPQDQRDGDDADGEDLIEENTTQALDFAQGAGVLNIQRSYENYHKGVTPRPGVFVRVSPDGNFNIRPAIATPDVALTNPLIPVITTPDEPDVPNFPELPGGGNEAATAPIDPETGLPISGPVATPITKSPLSIARALYQAGKGEPRFFSKFADTTDPDLRPGPGAGIIPFDPRVPFRPPAGGPGPGNGGGGGPTNPPPPLEIDILNVTTIGWDHAQVGQRPIRSREGGTTRTGWIDYAMNIPLSQGDVVTATLTWNRTVTVANPSFNPNNPRFGELRQLELEDLNLILMEDDGVSGPTPTEPIASSRTEWNNVEHIFYNVAGGGFHKFRVQWAQTRYDLFDNLPDGNVEFAIAWRVDLLGDTFAAARFDRPVATLSSMLAAFGSSYQQTAYDSMVDFNRDGHIDASDLSVFLAEWNKRSGR